MRYAIQNLLIDSVYSTEVEKHPRKNTSWGFQDDLIENTDKRSQNIDPLQPF